MKIVIDLQACQSSANGQRGIGRYSMMLARAMAELAQDPGRQHQVHLLLNNAMADTVGSVAQVFEALVPQNRIHVVDTPLGTAEQHAPAGSWRKRAAELVREHYLSLLKPDFIHVASHFEGWDDDVVSSVGEVVPPSDMQTAVTLYDLIPLMRPDVYLTNAKQRDWYYRRLRGIKSADLLLGISEFSAQEAVSILHLPPRQVVNISSAIDPVFAPRPIVDEQLAALKSRYGLTRRYVMYTSGIDPRKNIEGLIDAFGRLPTTIRNAFQLAIVCRVDSGDRERLLGLASRAGLAGDQVVLTGFVPDDDLISLYNEATLFVFPSLYEGFGMPVLEAMACGAPVIAADNSSIPEVVGRADALFDATRVDLMSAKMAQVLTDENMRLSLGRHGIERAKLFSWNVSAGRALDAFEAAHARQGTDSVRIARRAKARRNKLAFFSPLPPDKSGIADYSSELLPELTRYYDVDIIAINNVSDPWANGVCRIRTVDWFKRNFREYDRILYQIGNSHFHTHMFDLLEKYPGVVVLHDFFLSGAVSHQSNVVGGHAFARALFRSHGYPALLDASDAKREYAVEHYPMNKDVLDCAVGIIVHSSYSKTLAEKWYRAPMGRDWAVVPHLRGLNEINRIAARQKLGIPEDVFLTCSFGILAAAKMNHELLAAWLLSPQGLGGNGYLVFVGENYGGDRLPRMIAESSCSDRIVITGFASAELYNDYLCAADAGVQLRCNSRGETSGTILDCLAHGIPTIINANGSAAELPNEVLVKLPDAFTQYELVQALTMLSGSLEHRRHLAVRARQYIEEFHHPYKAGISYRDTIESFYTDPATSALNETLRDIACLAGSGLPSTDDLVSVARAVANNHQTYASISQLFVDISVLLTEVSQPSQAPTKLLEIMKALVYEQISGHRIEFVHAVQGRYRYARRQISRLLQLPDDLLEDSEIDVRPGDKIILLKTIGESGDFSTLELMSMRNRGVVVHLHLFCDATSTSGVPLEGVRAIEFQDQLGKLASIVRDVTVEDARTLDLVRSALIKVRMTSPNEVAALDKSLLTHVASR